LHDALPVPSPRAHHVRLVVEDEEVRRHRGRGVRLRLEELDQAHVEEALAEHLVHREEGGREAACAGKELAPAHAELLRSHVGEFLDAALDLLLLLRLRQRQVLAVRDHPGRDWRLERIGFRRHHLLELLVTEPGIFFPRTWYPLLGHTFLLSGYESAPESYRAPPEPPRLMV